MPASIRSDSTAEVRTWSVVRRSSRIDPPASGLALLRGVMPCGARVRESRAAVAISGALHRHSPVVANQAVADGPTKTIGAKHALGRSRFAMIFASPDGLAGDGAVATFTVVTPPSVGVRQLT